MHHTLICHHCCLGHHPLNLETLKLTAPLTGIYLRKRSCLQTYLTPYSRQKLD